MDNVLDSEDMEEEIEEEVEKVLTAIAGETAAQLPETVRQERLKQPAEAEEDAEVRFNPHLLQLTNMIVPPNLHSFLNAKFLLLFIWQL